MAGLPEKDRYSLREVAARWNCTADDLLQYGAQELLRISVVFHVPARVEWHDIDAIRNTTIEDGPVALAADAFRVNEPVGGFDPWSLRPPALGRDDWWGRPIEGGPWSKEQPKIGRRDLVIVREELERFERLHRIGARAPVDESAPVETAPPAVAVPHTMGNSTKSKRAHPLSAEIEAAKRKATNPDDVHAVYAVLQRWAELGTGPFIGFVQGEGCKYQTPDGVEFFTLDALRKRMKRAANN